MVYLIARVPNCNNTNEMSIVQNGSSIQHVCNLYHSLKFNCAIQRTIAGSEESLVRVKEQ